MNSSKSVLTLPLIAGSLLFSCSTETPEQQAPNIILILADDMGYSDISPFGAEIETPTLQKLADEGMIMTRFYNSARCCPTRASLLTGLYPQSAGQGAMADQTFSLEEYQGYLTDHSVTIAEMLRLKGYNTYMCGKWHIGDEESSLPHNRGFDKSLVFLNGATSYFNHKPYRDSAWLDITGSVELTVLLNGQEYTPPEEGYYTTDAWTDYAIGFIREDARDEKPFFLYMAYNAPHWPLHAKEEDIEKYLGRYDAGWTEIRRERFRKQQELGILPENCKLSPDDSKWLDWSGFNDSLKSRYSRKMAVHAAMIDCMDRNIGRILSTLEETGDAGNTLILFLSDNGGATSDEIAYTNSLDKSGPIGSEQSFTGYGPGWSNVSNTPWRENKAKMFFGGINTPFVAWYPGVIQPGTVTAFPGHITDVMPTFLELAGLDFPGEYNGKTLKPLPGHSLVPLFRGEEPETSRTLFFEHFGERAIIDQNWKLVSFSRSPWELYNLDEDPSELNNRVNELPEVAENLMKKYQAWADSTGVIPIEDHKKYRIMP